MNLISKTLMTLLLAFSATVLSTSSLAETQSSQPPTQESETALSEATALSEETALSNEQSQSDNAARPEPETPVDAVKAEEPTNTLGGSGLKNRNLSDIFEQFVPSETISADNAVPFPVDI
jgi:hypothetical protein